MNSAVIRSSLPWPVEAVDDPKAGVELGCWPNTEGALGFAPKAGAADAVAVKEDAADPKAGAVDCEAPNAGDCPEPKPEADVVVVKPNGATEGAGAEREEWQITCMEWQQTETYFKTGKYSRS